MKFLKENRKRIALVSIWLYVLLLTGCGNVYAKQEYSNETAMRKTGDRYSKNSSILNYMNDECSFNCGSFDGRQTLWTSQEKTDREVHVEISASIKSGHAKVILVDGEDDIVTLWDNEQEENVDVPITLKEGDNRIKFVGYDCKKIKLEMTMNQD